MVTKCLFQHVIWFKLLEQSFNSFQNVDFNANISCDELNWAHFQFKVFLLFLLFCFSNLPVKTLEHHMSKTFSLWFCCSLVESKLSILTLNFKLCKSHKKSDRSSPSINIINIIYVQNHLRGNTWRTNWPAIQACLISGLECYEKHIYVNEYLTTQPFET